jgi:hypothetical protein
MKAFLVVLSGLCAARAFGITMNTPPLLADPSTHPECITINVSKSTQVFAIQILDANGNVLGSAPACSIQPNFACTASAASTTGVVYCQATYKDKETGRVSLFMVDNVTGRARSMIPARNGM